MKTCFATAAAAVFFSALGVPKQVLAQSQTTMQSSDGTSQKLTVSLSSTHGVSTSAQMSPDFTVSTSAKMIIGPDSSATQSAADGISAILNAGSGGATQGITGKNVVNFGPGTEYAVTITPKELGANESRSIVGTASGSAMGTANTTLTIESTQSAFINTLTQQFR